MKNNLNYYHKEFLSYLSIEKNVSHHTLKNYKSDFIHFSNYLEDNSIVPVLINMKTPLFRSYIHYLYEENYKAATTRRKINSLKSFFNYLLLMEYITHNPLKPISVPNTGKRLPIYLKNNQVLQLLKAARASKRVDALRDYILIKLLVTTGIRRQEAVDLDFNHVDFENKTIRVIGKGNRERIIPIKEDLADELWLFLQSRLPLENNALFVTRNNIRIHTSRCQVIFRAILKDANLEGQGFTIHKLRHTYATALVSNGVPIHVVQTLLGHQSVDTTTVYAHTAANQLKDALSKLPY